jgi:hypothetical protein
LLASPAQGRARHSPVAVRLPLLPLKHPVTSRGVATISCAATAAPRRWTPLPCAIQSSEKWPRFPALHLPSQVVDASAVCCTVAAAVSCVNPSLPRRKAPLSRPALPPRTLQRSPSSPPMCRGDGPHHGCCRRAKADGVSPVRHPLVRDVATFSFAPAARPGDGRLPRHPSRGPAGVCAAVATLVDPSFHQPPLLRPASHPPVNLVHAAVWQSSLQPGAQRSRQSAQQSVGRLVVS